MFLNTLGEWGRRDGDNPFYQLTYSPYLLYIEYFAINRGLCAADEMDRFATRITQFMELSLQH